MKKILFIILLILLVSIGLRFIYSVGISFFKSKAKTTQIPPDVKVETIKEKEIVMTFDSPGRVESKYQVDVRARISGYLEKSYFKEGDYVKSGDTLFLIEPYEFQNASETAGANIQNIKAQLDYAEKQLARAAELVAQDYIAKSRYDEILSNRDSLKAQLRAAKSNFNDTNRNLSYTTVKSPVDGRIGFIDVTVGNYVTPSSGALTTINSIDPMYVTFSLPSYDYNYLSFIDGKDNLNRKTELYFSNGQKYEYDGIQDFYDNKIDRTTGSVTMRATFKNPNNRLLHGEFVNIKLYSNKSVKVPVVPIVAVQENQEGKYVYKLDKNNLPNLTYIKVQEQYGNDWIVKEGLSVGDRVITDGILKVTPESPVNIK
ncbi:efflux RND transporter periplasmic adaptor subunit [bacterium]|nr:efflux RND transporter periplasmic adaptor subunit [bacterium]